MIKTIRTSLASVVTVSMAGAAVAQIESTLPLQPAGYVTPAQMAQSFASQASGAQAVTYQSTSVSNAVSGSSVPSLKTASYYTPDELAKAYTSQGATTISSPSISTTSVAPRTTTVSGGTVYAPTTLPPRTISGGSFTSSTTAPSRVMSSQTITAPTINAPTVTQPEPVVASRMSGDTPRVFIHLDGGVAANSQIGKYGKIRLQSSLFDATNDNQARTYENLYSDIGYKLGYAGTARIGVEFENGFYGGFEASYRNVGMDSNTQTLTRGDAIGSTTGAYVLDGEVNSVAGFLTAGYTLPTEGIFRPFIDASIGLAMNTASATANWEPTSSVGLAYASFSESFASKSTGNLAYGVSIGANIQVTETVTLRAGYRYRNNGVARTQAGVRAGANYNSANNTTANHVEFGVQDAHEAFVGVGVYF